MKGWEGEEISNMYRCLWRRKEGGESQGGRKRRGKDAGNREEENMIE